MPFADKQLRISPEKAKTIPLFQKYEGTGPAAKQDEVWRCIGDDWLTMSEDLAIHLANHTNNASVALAIELPESQKALLFVADAQLGHWIAWSGRASSA